MYVCFGRVSLHCFTSCTPGIIYGPISSHCMGVVSRWNYNGDFMIKNFQEAGVVTPSKPPFEQLSPLPTFIPFTATALLIHHPFSPHKNVDHTLRCVLFMVFTKCQYPLSCSCIHQEMIVDCTEILLYTQE